VQATTEYVRFRSVYQGAKGYKVGVFGLVNVLGRHGMLTPDEERFRRESTRTPSPRSRTPPPNSWSESPATSPSWTLTESPGNRHAPAPPA
jgi:hypothetical protein